MQARVVSEFKRWTTLMSAADRGNEQEVAAVLAEGDCHLYRKTKVSRFERCFLLNNHACRVLSGDSIANRSPPTGDTDLCHTNFLVVPDVHPPTIGSLWSRQSHLWAHRVC
jgi:hypothetical protein